MERKLAKRTAVQHEIPAGQRILAAAKRLFAEQGFHQTAVADLAREADVSVGAIYRLYASKSDIILAIIVADSERKMANLQEDVDRVQRGEVTIAVAIEQLVLRSLSNENEALTYEMLAEAHRNPRVAAGITEFCVTYRAIFRQLAMLARPTLSGDELEGGTELMLACLFGLGNRLLTQPSLDEATTAKVTARMILAALGVPPPAT